MGDETMQSIKKKATTTSLKIEAALWKEAKVKAIEHDITLSQLIEEAIRLWIDEKEHLKKGKENGKAVGDEHNSPNAGNEIVRHSL
jgi:predicted DNA-binding ribbon-helix-helix protein